MMTKSNPAVRLDQGEPRGATVAQLRADINNGRTGDKIAATDHAIAPLGTDEEAAGTPVAAGTVASAREYECNRTTRRSSVSAGELGLYLFLAVLVLAGGFLAVVALAVRLD